jgi:hypothetical protein
MPFPAAFSRAKSTLEAGDSRDQSQRIGVAVADGSAGIVAARHSKQPAARRHLGEEMAAAATARATAMIASMSSRAEV